MPHEQFVGTAAFTTAIGGASATTKRTRRSRRPSQSVRAGRRELTFLAAVAALVATVVVTARAGLFTAGSDLGYWIGVAGGTAMLLLFVYPLRKRWRRMREFGPARFWFSLHMSLGIAGPLLIILHSTLRFGSVNATVAFTAMVVVAISGLAGRYLYGRIHHGLYGRRATLAELRAQAGMDSEDVRSKLGFVPRVEERLRAFAQLAEATGQDGLGHPLRFMALGLKAIVAQRWCVGETTRVLRERARIQGWPEDKLAQRVRSRRALIRAQLRAVQRVAQFGVFERLFSWWHVLHVPLVYMMVLSAIAHVIAVHMY